MNGADRYSGRAVEVEVGQLTAGGNTKLRVGLVKVVTDSAGAEEQLASDLTIGRAGGRQAYDLKLLRCEPAEWIRSKWGSGDLSGGS